MKIQGTVLYTIDADSFREEGETDFAPTTHELVPTTHDFAPTTHDYSLIHLQFLRASDAKLA